MARKHKGKSKRPLESPRITVDGIHDIDDYTLILAPGDLDKGDDAVLRAHAATPDLRGTPIVLERRSHREVRYVARALVCTCFRGARLSLTVRGAMEAPSDGVDHRAPYQFEGTAPMTRTAYAPSTKAKADLSIARICEVLAELIFAPERVPDRGLIVVSGSTASAKSLVARGLIHHYLFSPRLLGSASGRKRRPHLVTCEDPIEKELLPLEATADFDAYDPIRLGVDYTPREIGSDVKSLAHAIRDAKRQTPSVFFFGETRHAEDWQALLQFAGTGHLVVTTTHAESLQVTLATIFKAVGADTPARRGEVASRIRALVHQRNVVADSAQQAILPSLWRQTPQGVAELVADGLSAIIPNNPRSASDRATPGADHCCLGRAWFATRLFEGRPDKLREYVRHGARLDISGD